MCPNAHIKYDCHGRVSKTCCDVCGTCTCVYKQYGFMRVSIYLTFVLFLFSPADYYLNCTYDSFVDCEISLRTKLVECH